MSTRVDVPVRDAGSGRACRPRDDGQMSEALTGRKVLVTGASPGIGAAIAEATVGAGGRVALLARSADTIRAQADRLGDAAVAAAADVTDAEELAAAIGDAVEQMGGLDAVVCSAGVVRPGGIFESAPPDWQLMFDVNVLGVLHTVYGALDRLRAFD